MNLSKSYEFFNPDKINGKKVHIVGCGSVGSTIAENLARCGVRDFVLWDFDSVEPHNLHNQMFLQKHLGMAKVDALKDVLCMIDTTLEETIELKPNGWSGELLSGYVFLCVDNIDLRREFVEKHMQYPFLKAVFDIRTEMTGAQHYAASWNNLKSKQNLLNTMQFSHDEAKDEAPVSACGVTLGLMTTVRLVCGVAVNNFIKGIKGEKMWKTVLFNGYSGTLDCFEEKL